MTPAMAPAVAIVGYGCALPGVSTTAEMAAVLRQRRRTYARFSPERIPPGRYLDEEAAVGEAKLYTTLGGMIAPAAPAAEGADAPRSEVHRQLLEVLGRALASAQLAPSALRGQPAPVLLAHSRGGGHGLYDAALLAAARRLLPHLLHAAHPHELTAAELAAAAEETCRQLRASFGPEHIADPQERAVTRLAGLLAEELGTTEKALIVDGNCTGGLIALELAQRELAGGAPWVIAGALSHVDTVNQVLYANSRLLSKHGCDPFAERGDGTVISDGIVLLVLTSLARARSERLPIHGVIRGVGGGNDGAVERYMLTPNPRGHQLAIARAQDRAGVSPTEPGVFLSHGSGTRAGDTVEAAVFSAALSRGGGRPPVAVPVLSIKGHVGHAKEAAGLANLVALLAMFESEQIAPPAHDQPIRRPPSSPSSPAVVELARTAAPWPAGERPRIGGISAIASGGQNYHAVVEEPPSPARMAKLLSAVSRGAQPAPRRGGWRDEPIAVVGVAAELGGAPDLRAFWQNLLAGKRSFSRGAWEGLAATLGLTPQRFAARAARYGERPADILRHDPLHFLLVDLAVAAAAGTGVRPGDNASVVVSAEHGSEYGLRQVAAARLPEVEAALARALAAGSSGQDPREIARTVRGAMKRLAGELPELWAGSLFNVSPSFWAARIARAFDLTGPVCALEAGAAASSMAGLEVACARLADREVDAAFWAAADVRVGELRHGDERAAERLSRAAAPTALDAGADGYLLGEAATVCVLRRLSDARARGEPIYGVIRAIGSAFAPPRHRALVDEAALAQAIERAHARCDVAVDELAFVECFGSGHPPSDAAEVAALRRTLGAARTRPLPLGAVMPNVGHTGAAAGAVSLLKALLALGARTLPGTAGVRAPIAGGALQVATHALALPEARFAAINAAGPGGTHYHVVVERGSHALELDV